MTRLPILLCWMLRSMKSLLMMRKVYAVTAKNSIQETQGDKLISEFGPDVEPEPDDHLGYELRSGSMWVSEPDMEPGQDDDQNEWQVLFWHSGIQKLTEPTIIGLKMIFWRLRTSHVVSRQVRGKTSLSTAISITVTAFSTTIHVISMTINAIQPGQMKIL